MLQLTKIVLTITCMMLLVQNLHSQEASPFSKVKPVAGKMRPLQFPEVKPSGWLLEQIRDNLEGFTGHLDSLVPALIVNDDIYGKDRLGKHTRPKSLGAITDNADEMQAQFFWWNSETQGNWLDGYLRSAILAGDQFSIRKLRDKIAYLLSTQDSDGYLGIYDRELRYNFTGENGELWSKTTLMRALLAWYGYSGDSKVLDAVVAATTDVMKNWPAWSSHPFLSSTPDVGGLSHGLAFTDILEELWRITGDEKYRDYCIFLYADFSGQKLNEDAQFAKLNDSSLRLKGHAVHTTEHLRSVAAAAYASGDPRLLEALDRFQAKLEPCLSPSGGPAGDEWIAGQYADATLKGYEYCSIHELMVSYLDLMARTGAPSYGDLAERIFFNAAQGSRHPAESSIAYLRTDNSYAMTGGLNGDTSIKNQTRYKFSPVHQDVAVCCVPNAGRIAPWFVQNMWMRDDRGLVAALLGPCSLETTFDGSPVSITETTDYPYRNRITFRISSEVPFELRIRKPEWVKEFSLNTPYRESGGYIVVSWKSRSGSSIVLELKSEPRALKDHNGETYFTRGPLLLARPVDGIPFTVKTYPQSGFRDLEYSPLRNDILQLDGDPALKPSGPTDCTVRLFSELTKKKSEVRLIPLGKTILRQVTFKEKK